MKAHRALLFTVACVLLAGCGSAGVGKLTGTVVPSPVTAATATSTLLAPVASTERALLTNAPEPATTATIIPSATPDVPLSANGPWLVFLASVDQWGIQYLWAINADGSGLARLIDEPVLNFRVRPHSSAAGGVTIAYITGVGRGSEKYGGYELKLISIPGGEARTIVPLVNASIDPEDKITLDNLVVAINEGSGLTWSPDGSRLAFVGMLNDSSVDAYSYDYAQGEVSRMSSLPTHSYDLSWSPDGSHLLYKEFIGIGMSGPEEWGGYWSVKADGSGAQMLSQSATSDSYGWLSSTEIILDRSVGTWDDPEMAIYTANIETGDSALILRDIFDRAVFSRERNTWLLTQLYEPELDIPLVMYQYGKRTEIPGHGIVDIFWSGEDDAFFGQSNDGMLYAISASGEITEASMQFEADVPGMLPARAISPDGQWWAWYGYAFYEGSSRLWVGKPMTTPLLCLASDIYPEDSPYYNGPLFTDVTWSLDSQRLFVLTFEHGLLSLEQPDFEPARIVMGLRPYSTRHDWQATWIP